MEPPDPRVYLAAERTFLAWVRTGLALMGLGFIVARFSLFLHYVGAKDNPSVAQQGGKSLSSGIALIILGVMVHICAAVRHHRQIRSIDRGEFRNTFGSLLAATIAGLLAAIGLAIAAYIAGLAP